MTKNSQMKVIDCILCDMTGRESKLARITNVVISGETVEGIRAMADLLLVHKRLLSNKQLEVVSLQARLANAEAQLHLLMRPLPAVVGPSKGYGIARIRGDCCGRSPK